MYVKHFFKEINCKKSVISNTVCGTRHSKPTVMVGHPVLNNKVYIQSQWETENSGI